MKPHIHAELIKKWADGAKIQRYFFKLDGKNELGLMTIIRHGLSILSTGLSLILLRI